MDYVNQIIMPIVRRKAGIKLYRVNVKRFLQKFVGAALIALCAALLGLLFYRFGGIRYFATGANGVMTGADVSFSIVVFLFFILFYFICGLCAVPGSTIGLIVLSTLIIGGGIVGYLGYAYLLGNIVGLYFLFLAPIVPILELLSRIPVFSASSDLLFIIVPSLLAALKFSALLIGKRIRYSPELVERSLRKIDRFYEYRQPVEGTQDVNIKSA